jgi:hypothetical protein
VNPTITVKASAQALGRFFEQARLPLLDVVDPDR